METLEMKIAANCLLFSQCCILTCSEILESKYVAAFMNQGEGRNWQICKQQKNIARGTTDPDIDSVTWIKFSNNMSTLALVPNLATRWRHLHELQLWPPDGATCITHQKFATYAISCKFDHQMAPLALVANLANIWHNLDWFKIW